MVLTITPNPLLERRFYLDSFHIGVNNRSNSERYAAGGKGINVSRQLNLLGIKNLAYTFLGGAAGKKLRELLFAEKINHTAIPAKSETRSAALIVEDSAGKLTTIFPPNPKPSAKEINEFIDKLKKMIDNCSTVVFSGSSPSEEAAEIFTEGVKIANRLDKVSILDTYGSHLEETIKCGPTVLHNNLTELSSSLGKKLEGEGELIRFLQSLHSEHSISLSFITNGDKPAYASRSGFVSRVDFQPVKEIDPTGSGDAFVAGIVYGLEKSLVFEEFVKIAAALGSANAAVWDVCSATKSEYEMYLPGVMLTPVGKKMKLIDDAATFH